MKFLSPRNRIAMGLTGAVIAVICLAKMAGYIPDSHQLSMQSRTDIAETIAMSSSALLVSSDAVALESFLEGITKRNSDLQSVGVRHADGELGFEFGGHAEFWNIKEDERSSLSQMQVPIYKSANEKWGSIELRFAGNSKSGILGLVESMGLAQMLFISSSCFLLFSFILSLVLKHLDPSKAVPQRVRDALNNLAEGLMILDTKYNVLLANTAFAEVLGESAENLVGRNSTKLNFFVDEDDCSSLATPWETALNERRPISNSRIKLADSEGVIRTYLVNCSPLLGHQGNYCGVMVTLDDVTQLETSRVQLREARDAADAASQAKSDFLANMSHEIRTPMNAILGFTDVLRRGMEDNPGQRMEYLNTIHSSGNHLIELINDILDLSKVEAGKLEMEYREFCLPTLLHETIHVLSARAEQKSISLAYEVIDRIPETTISDATRIRQVLINLIGNAIKFTEVGGIFTQCKFENNTLVFSISDTGIGMTPEQSEKIFEAFTQADTSVTRRFGGTGLGLSISKKFVEALGGSITVNSEVGTGTTFVVTVPVQTAPSTRHLDQTECLSLVASSSKPSVDAMSKLNPGTVLVVDDGETNRNVVSAVLRKHGIEILEAENGKVAIDIIESNANIDVVLMDMQMPVMDGYSATQHVRSTGNAIPIIALTGNVMDSEKQKCMQSGCDGFLPKPFEIEKLVDTIGEYVGFSGELLSVVPTTETQTVESSVPTCEKPTSQTTSMDTVEPWTSTLPLDDPEFLRIVRKFVDELPEKLTEMAVLIEAKDFETLKDRSHWLKGSAGTVGLGRITEPAKLLESAAINCDHRLSLESLQQIASLSAAITIPEPVLASAEQSERV